MQRTLIFNHFNYRHEKICRRLLYALVILLVFEGLVRKISPLFISNIIFFFKDVLCLIAIYILINKKSFPSTSVIYRKWYYLLILFLPVFFNTIPLDVILGFFGLKQYLLYFIVAILVPNAFPPNKSYKFKEFVTFFNILLIPTTMVAILQNALPASSWLNLAVGGDSLENFSAGGFLRVSSTFSFVGQYCYFLNVISSFFVVGIYLKLSHKRKYNKYLLPLYGFAFIIGIFITGSRTSVLGSGVILFIGFILSSLSKPQLMIKKLFGIGIILILTLYFIRIIKPEFFAAYDARSKGQSKEVTGRITGAFTGETLAGSDKEVGIWNQEAIPMLLGNGIGVMSNGSEKLSEYAREIRKNGFWTESDFTSVFWEGGAYLVVIWFGLRFSIILFCFRLWRRTHNDKYNASIAFLLGLVIVYGTMVTLSIQPPLAIWWWLAVGSIITINNFDKFEENQRLNLRKKY